MKKLELSVTAKNNIFWWSGIISLIGLILWTVFTGEWWWLVLIAISHKFISPIANGIALHRYFSHRSFKTGPLRHKFLLWISVLGAAGSPISYASVHRHHHKYTDTPRDIHSPHVSRLEAWGWWVTRPPEWFIDQKQMGDFPKDLIRQSDVAFVHRHYYKFWMFFALVSLAISWKMLLLFTLPYIGFYAIMSALIVNVYSHIKIWGSYRNFETDDRSQNNKWIHWWSLQEGLHNNHHYDMSKYDQAMRPGEFDPAGWIVRKFFDIDLQNIKKSDKNLA